MLSNLASLHLLVIQVTRLKFKQVQMYLLCVFWADCFSCLNRKFSGLIIFIELLVGKQEKQSSGSVKFEMDK